MKVIKILREKSLLILLIFISSQLSLSCKFSKKEETQLSEVDVNQDEKNVANFLVNSTEVNNKIIQISKVVGSNSKSIEVKNLFADQVKITNDFQDKLRLISEERFVSIPLTDRISKVSYTNDSVSLNMLKKNLTTQKDLLENLKINESSRELISIKNNYLPKITTQLEKINQIK